MVASFTQLQPMLGIAHGELKLVYAQLLGNGNPFHEANSSCADVASRDSLELGRVLQHMTALCSPIL
jgi:hypothetical protein